MYPEFKEYFLSSHYVVSTSPVSPSHMQSRILAQRPPPVLLLDVDTQTDNVSTTVKPTPQPVGASDELDRIHLSLISRMNELELQNSEIQDSVDEIRSMLCEFKRMWESKVANESKTDVLLRNIGVLS